MEIYVALLRGINVGGTKPIRMEKLRAAFESLGYRNVTTYLQSGNVVFRANAAAMEEVREKLEVGIRKSVGFEVPVVVRRLSEIKAIIARDPFKKEKLREGETRYVTFLSAKPSPPGVKKLNEIDGGQDRMKVVGAEVFLSCVKGYSRNKYSNTLIEKVLRVTATTRNWATTCALYDIGKVMEAAASS